MKSVRPKKFLGQHFLTDLPTAQRIADTVDACPDLPILEVGPGMGVMTQYLLPKGRPFKVVEIDFESVEYLRKAFPALEEGIIEDDDVCRRTTVLSFCKKSASFYPVSVHCYGDSGEFPLYLERLVTELIDRPFGGDCPESS